MSSSIGDLYGLNNSYDLSAVYDNSGSNAKIGMDDFLKLMVAELQNQDFTSSESTDSSTYITQLAQISSMQQMEQLAYYSKINYVTGLIGKEVTVASYSLGGKVNSTTGVVEKISLSSDDNDYEIVVNGTSYSLSNVMSVNDSGAVAKSEMSTVAKMTPYLLKRNSDSATVAWNAPKATDDTLYTYSVYYSEDDTFDSAADVKKGTFVTSIQGGDDLTAEIDDLEPDTRYYVNVLISTSNGSEEVYQKLAFTTKSE